MVARTKKVAYFAHLEACLSKRNSSSLRGFLADMREHFAFEETMFREHNYGSGKEQFSATRSHILDHEALVAMVESELGKLSSQIWQRLSVDFLNELVARWITHVEIFDTKYAQFCS